MRSIHQSVTSYSNCEDNPNFKIPWQYYRNPEPNIGNENVLTGKCMTVDQRPAPDRKQKGEGGGQRWWEWEKRSFFTSRDWKDW